MVQNKKRLQMTIDVRLLSLMLIFVILPMFIFGVPQLVGATMRCRDLPYIASNFAASQSYAAPGDANYMPAIWSTFYCTEQSAQADGYHRVFSGLYQ